MSIADTQTKPAGRTYTCLIAEVIKADEKPEAAADALADRLAAKNTNGSNAYSNRNIGVWLGVSEATVMKHRNGNCVCARSRA